MDFVPIQFWFNRNSGLAMPICSLNIYEKSGYIEYNKLNDIKLIDNYELSELAFYEYEIKYIPPIFKTININLNNIKN